ncbi:MAG: hypothetical protein COX81_02820 [Candidatus Magasanikbacteria bacterium CG_4_10_14_0_2_um_filter_37_12]|uniref:Nucleotidyl transferase domain-containing protein n=1 Tax=Candidatus Magasanikbacteria bacterium CG_4_10_14_0_2_um_filter_37_12 TaxID=1974637 RepID=A0A2M7V7R0_9BACT|nr:MAG: hypothetical protein COX81_02820 [Candidatus Magasanikbacteria bacterium CG_4_10_14_0_2_um_filter_37_12]
MNVIILCGGLSTRLGDITKDVPKILLPIAGRTVLDLQLDMFADLEIKEIIFAAGHLSEVLEKHVGDKYAGYGIKHVVEEKRLGTGGAIKNAFNFVSNPDEPTIILNGDVLTTIDLSDMVGKISATSDGIILASRVDNAFTYGTLNYDDQFHLDSFQEKKLEHIPGYINGGVYIFNPQIKKYFPVEEIFSVEYNVFPFVKDLYVYESDRPWVDVGVPERLEWARENWHKIL